MKEIVISGKKFREIIDGATISNRVSELASMINNDLRGREVIFIGILNGAFIFTAELMRKIDLDARVSFIKIASYKGTESSGVLRELIGLDDDVKNKHLIVVEDIVDTGATLAGVVRKLSSLGAVDIRIASLLFKPAALKEKININYVGFEIPDDFVIGYGLDYNGFGRNLPAVYALVG
jgi:hypoxanthine phosphoribosyltransferase